MSGQPEDRPWDRAPDGQAARDGLGGPDGQPGAHPPDPTAIPSSTPYAPVGPGAYGTAPVDPGGASAVVPPPVRSGLTKRDAKLITSISPFVALVLFFVLRGVDGPPAWLAFLLIPLASLVTEHLRGDKRDGRD